VNTASELLAFFKEQDKHNVGIVSLVTSRPIYTTLCAAWPNVARCLSVPADEDLPADLPSDVRLRWLWSRVEPSPGDAWAEIANLPSAPHVRQAMAALQENCAVFPDGSMSEWVFNFLAKRAKNVGAYTGDDGPTPA
jgi:hypothetical protein